MEILNTHTGNISTTENLTVRGILSGQLNVNTGHIADIKGIVTKDIIANKGSTVYINGTVNGNVINNGGIIEVYGIINGSLTTLDGDTKIAPNAIVQK